MPEVKIFNIQDSKLDKKVAYESGNESLFEILEKYDPSIGKNRCRVAIGSDLFHNWTIPIEICFAYGDSISISYIDPSANELTIFVVLLNGRKTPIKVEQNATIEEIKEKIQEIAGIPFDQQRLFLKGRRLEEGRCLDEYGIMH